MAHYYFRIFRGLVQIGLDQKLKVETAREAREECFALASDFGRQIMDDLQVVPDWRLELYSTGNLLILKIAASVETESGSLSPFSGTVIKGLPQTS